MSHPASESRYKFAPTPGLFNLALVEPEIPPNTGSIGRLCASTHTPLHLVGKLGFSLDQKAVRRAGLDYWPKVNLTHHGSLQSFRERKPPERWVLFSAHGERPYHRFEFEPGDVLVFGCESRGLPGPLVEQHPAQRVLAIPSTGVVRSLNLAMAAGIVLFEALRQVGALDSTS